MNEQQMDEQQRKAAEIREKFGKKPTAAEKVSNEQAQVDTIREKAKERELLYAEVGAERATEQKKKVAKDDKARSDYRTTTLRLLVSDILRFKKLEGLYLSENVNLTYEKVFKAGLEKIEKMTEDELHNYIENLKN